VSQLDERKKREQFPKRRVMEVISDLCSKQDEHLLGNWNVREFHSCQGIVQEKILSGKTTTLYVVLFFEQNVFKSYETDFDVSFWRGGRDPRTSQGQKDLILSGVTTGQQRYLSRMTNDQAAN